MSERTCSIPECAKPARSRGWCSMHYTRWKRHGDPHAYHVGGPEAMPPLDRLLRHVDASGDCWEWTASHNAWGYGTCRGDGIQSSLAHRALWIELIGDLDPDLTLDHLCRNTACVNPDHLEPVPHAENVRRSYRWPEGKGACRLCDQPHHARGYCQTHYSQFRDRGEL